MQRSKLCVLLLPVVLITARADVPFVRGDTNADGAVDIVDAANILQYLFAGEGPPACKDAWDSNDDVRLDIADALLILDARFLSGPPLAEPAASPGVDPTPDEFGCTEQTEYAALPAPSIVLGALDASIPGGVDSFVETTIWLTADHEVTGLEFSLRLEGVEDARFEVGPYEDVHYGSVAIGEEGRTVGFIPDLMMSRYFEPGEGIPILRLMVCVPEGTAPGSYQLLLEDARIAARRDLHAFLPATVAGEITVERPVTAFACPPLPDPPPTHRPGVARRR